MSDTADLDELKKRKERLLLEQEVARLERKQQLRRAGNWRWWWVAPLGALGALSFLDGISTGYPVPVLLGLVGMIPVGLKVYFKRV